MTTQNEALRLADLLGNDGHEGEAADELRRLQAENEELRKSLAGWVKENAPGGWIDNLRKDAERYRWLRAGNYSFTFAKGVLNDTALGIDKSIDTAIAKQKGGV